MEAEETSARRSQQEGVARQALLFQKQGRKVRAAAGHGARRRE